MPQLHRTFSERIDAHPAMDALAGLHGAVRRKLYVEIHKGRVFAGDLATSFYQRFGISQRRLVHIHSELNQAMSSVREKAKYDAGTYAEMAKAKRMQIRKAEKRLADARKTIAEELELRKPPELRAKPKRRGRKAPAQPNDQRLAEARAERDRIPAQKHQHKRRLSRLEHLAKEASRVAAMAVPPLCFGSRKLFASQHHLEENGFRDHAEWKAALDERRSEQFVLIGEGHMPSGNQFARLTAVGDEFELEVRLPDALRHLAERTYPVGGQTIHSVTLRGLTFAHGAAELRQALRDGRPITWRFVRDASKGRRGSSWRALATINEPFDREFVEDRYASGCIGVDFNADHVAVTQVDGSGNVVKTWRYPLVTVGRTEGQREAAARQVASDISSLAEGLGLPVVAEKLDFSRKKAQLTASKGARYARMLSSLAHAAFGEALERACVRRLVPFRRVNPAYTSVIGHLKFAPRYGLSVHAAAAMSIARRAMGRSERVPEPLVLLHEDGERGTLRRPEWRRKVRHAPDADAGIAEPRSVSTTDLGRRHVWSAWRHVARERDAALAGRRRARHGPRSTTSSGGATAPEPGVAGRRPRRSAGGSPAAKWGPSGASATGGALPATCPRSTRGSTPKSG